ncbi:hypothetical protein [Devosia sp. 2618]|uniref:hypothetical protein n=1 Tax=Devosia sp. 2618 TaxID=3156454 RepID=UPI00339B9620
MTAATSEEFAQVYWIGGGSGGGKSTIAARLAERFGIALYPTDTTMLTHAEQSTTEEAPQLERFKRMSMDERWLTRDPRDMLESFHWFEGEAFELILRDLRAYPRSKPVLVEGLRLLPHLVAPHLARPTQALWLLPTPEFRAVAFERRGTLWDIAGKTSRPPDALRNLFERDAMFTERLQGELRKLELPSLTVDGQRSFDDTVDLVAAMLELS